MPTNAKRYAVDTSVAVAALDSAHSVHQACVAAVRQCRPALAGHAAFETYSVLTRMPGLLSVDALVVSGLIERVFPELLWPALSDISGALRSFGEIGVSGGAVYDALVGLAARSHDVVLLTRDLRARRMYDLLGVRYELVGFAASGG